MKRTLIILAAALLSACQTLPQKTFQSERHTASATAQARQTSAEAEPTSPMADIQLHSATRSASSAARPPRDLLEKITRDFSLLPEQKQDFSAYIAFYQRYPRHLQRVLQRAKPFLPMIYDEIRKRNMPTEIALLPAVESAFIPTAYSWQGAAGLWQFTRATARIEGLKMNWWYDARRDPVVSTRAALDYLQKLHGMTGNWLLALAAYNGGIGTVLNAMKRTRKRLGREQVTFWDIRKELPRETQKYVPQLMALCTLLKQPELLKTELPAIPFEPTVKLIRLKSQTDLAAARRLSNVPWQTFRHLNAGYRHNATPPDGPHHLLLPVAAAQRVLAALNKHPSLLAVKLRHHRIRPGESLILLARRYGTTVSTLKRLNGLKGNLLVAGRTLVVPDIAPRKNSKMARDGKAKKVRSGQIVVVHRGETLWDIARRYRMKVSTLAQANGLSVRRPIRPGQRLRIPARYTSKRIVHRVRPGESLWLVARRYNTSTQALKRWNALEHTRLKPGQKLVIWLDRDGRQASNS